MRITKKLLREWSACWSNDKIDAKLKALGKKSMTPRELAADDTVTLDDRLWVLCCAIAHLDESAARRFAAESALTVAHLAGDEIDQEVFRGLCNEIVSIEDLPVQQRNAARGAAWDAAWGAAWDAAWGAAWGAAWDAARGAAWDAARNAARDAAWDAARDAAWDAARDAALTKSIAIALEWLGPHAD